MNLWTIFITGLTAGGLSCLAMQGGLLTSMIANQKRAALAAGDKAATDGTLERSDIIPVALFLGSKLIVHIFFGMLLGLLGSVLTLSLPIRLGFQFLAAFFMFATAMNLLDVHPIFRFVSFEPPASVARFIRRRTKHAESVFAPVVLGALTIFIPCGVTQAMEVQAIATGNLIAGGLLLGTFVLGTIPLFAIVGIATARLSERMRTIFLHLAAVALIVLSLASVNGILEVIGSPVSWSRFESWLYAPVRSTNSRGNLPAIVDGMQQVELTITGSGYSPRLLTVKRGIPVNLTLRSIDGYSCAADFTMRTYGIRQFVEPNTSKIVRFTPDTVGKIPFSCSMGMYTGVIEVVE